MTFPTRIWTRVLSTLFVAAVGFTPGAAMAQTLTIGTASGDPGAAVSIDVTVDTLDPLRGVSCGITHDIAVLTLDTIDQGQATLDTNAGAGPDFFQLSTDPMGGTGGYFAAVFDFELVGTLPVGDDQVVAVFNYTIDAGAAGDTTTDLEFSDLLGDPAVQTLVVVDLTGVVPTQVNGSVSILAPAPMPFRRGDVNGDTALVGIVDAVALLCSSFLPGECGAVPCEDAADADDDGTIDPIVDALAILNYAYGGAAAPPAPGPDTCGEDPTADGLECATLPDCT